MAATVCNGGRNVVTQRLLGQSTAVSLTLKIFVSNTTPTVTDTPSTYTECSVTGYAAQALTASSWSGSTTGGVATYTYPAVTFTFSANVAAQTAYGYYVVETNSNTVLFAQQFSSNYPIPAAGGSVTVNLTWIDQ